MNNNDKKSTEDVDLMVCSGITAKISQLGRLE